MSYLDIVDRATLFSSLCAIDLELEGTARGAGCPHCGGPLHSAPYPRKPRGAEIEIPDAYRSRRSLCCGRCRRRTLPPSVLFFGRRVYWGCVVMLVTAAAQGLERHTIDALSERFSVARRTIKRWLSFFACAFPKSSIWQRARGRVSPRVGNEALPRGLLSWFFEHQGTTQQAIIACSRLMAGADDIGIQGSFNDTQKMPS